MQEASMEPEVYCQLHAPTGSWQYLVIDASTRKAVIIDPVLDFDAATLTLGTETPDKLLALAEKHGADITKVLETHAHADHLTASRYIQHTLVTKGKARPDVCIGRRIKTVQRTMEDKYGINHLETENAFDHLFEDNETFSIGNLNGEVLYLPGHTPDHVGYKIGSNVFTGDSIFNPDVGSARCDFPGGSSDALFKSIQTLLSLPGDVKLYTGHDYPPESRGTGHRSFTTVKEQAGTNKHVNKSTRKEDFVQWRTERDASLGNPKLLHYAMQLNVRGGRLPEPTGDGKRIMKVPAQGESVLKEMNNVECLCF